VTQIIMSVPLRLFSQEVQTMSHYPAIPPPVPVDLWNSPPHPCPYRPGRMSTMRAVMSNRVAPEIYHQFMDANFRRSGRVIYQPTCAGCRQCQSLRVLVREFQSSKSQRRCWRKNSDLLVAVHPPQATEEKFALYRKYLLEWHDRADAEFDEFVDFLYRSPVETIEFEYRDREDRLVAVGICDRSGASLSSVYFYFDPAERDRSLGTYGALREIEWAATNGIPYYYLGYWVADCAGMKYKASFHPHEVLGSDGTWRASE
jgi:arginyl-tRNA--protein-N-Asp/Glu arginylyltransferase